MENGPNRRLGLVAAVSGALLALGLLLLALNSPATLAAPRADADPAIHSLSVTANLPISDTRPGAAVNRTVFFSNTSAGVLTLTLNISGTPTLSLTAGAAFGHPARVWTSTTAPWMSVVTYDVASGAGDWPGVVYTAVNTNGVQAAAVLTYVQDITAPLSSISAPPDGAVLTGTQATVTGQASDAGSGVQRVQWSANGTWQDVDQAVHVAGTVFWTATWALPMTDGAPYTLTTRAQDWLGTWQSVWATVPVTVDTVAPTATAPLPHLSPWVTTTVVYTWPASSDGSGIAGYHVEVTSTQGYSDSFSTAAPELTFTQALVEGASYVARVRAADGAGNVGDWSEPSVGVTPDLTPPDVTDPSIYENSTKLCALGTRLYYTNTIGVLEQVFAVLGTSTDGASGVARVHFSPALDRQPSDDVTGFTPWQSASPNYAIIDGENRSGVISATVVDAVGNGQVQTYTFELDGAGPYTGSVVIAGGAEYVTQTNVTLTLFAADTGCGVTEMCVSSSGACSDWQSYVTTRGWDLGGSTGLQTVYAWFRDGLGNISTQAMDTVYADHKPPTGTIVIDGQAAYATQVTVTLTLTATDEGSGVASMRFRNDGGAWSDWEANATTRDGWLLSDAEGVRTVAAQFRDAAGNVSEVVSDTIVLDRQPPQISSFLIDGGAAYAIQVTVTLEISGEDTFSGIAQARFANDEEAWSPWETYTTNRSGWLLDGADGMRTVSAQFVDGAGNVSAVYSDTIFRDRQPPVVTVTAPARIAATEIPVQWQAVDPELGSGLTGFYDVEYREDAGGWQPWLSGVSFTATTFTSATLQVGQVHTYTFRVTAYDHADNAGVGTAQSVVRLFGVYLPLIYSNWKWWYQIDIYEPNDTFAQAYGPLVSGDNYDSYIWDATDRNDYYTFTPTVASNVHIALTNIPSNCDFDLYVYYFDGQQYQMKASSANYGQSNESVDFVPLAGQQYFVRVYAYAGFSQQPYRLRVTYQ